MFKNYIKTALRNLLKNKLISFINIFGLSIAIGISMVVYVFIEYDYTRDGFHKNRYRTFLVKNVVNRDGEMQVWGDSPAPIGEMIRQDFPQVENVVRIVYRAGYVKYEEKVFREYAAFVDPDFSEVFTFPLKWGSYDALQDESSVILSEHLSIKYFGDENPTGKQITFRESDERVENFRIVGVMHKRPKKSSLYFNMLFNIGKVDDVDPDIKWDNWSKFIDATFVMLKSPEDIYTLENGVEKYVKLQNKAEQDWPAENYTFEPLSTLSFNSEHIRDDISGGSDKIGRIVLAVIGIFLLALATLNYINIAISSASKRLKEIGMRKVMGSLRKNLIAQFLIENLIIAVIALVLGTMLGAFLFVRWFDAMFSIGLEFTISDPLVWVFFVGLVIITGIASGAYPALYISSFQPVNIFRGKQKFGGKNRFTRIFVTFQFILSIITIIAGLVFIQNAKYTKEIDWGYNQESVLVVPVRNLQQYTALKNKFEQNPDILATAGSYNHIGRSTPLAIVEIENEKYEVIRFEAGENYQTIYDLRLKSGRFLNPESQTDLEESIVINQTFADQFNWDDPIGKRIRYDSAVYNVVGLVEDFHYDDFFDLIAPTFIKIAEKEYYRFLSARVREGALIKTSEYMEATWKESFPEYPYRGFFQDQVFQNYFNNITGHGKIMGFVATLSILLSCMGLFGLVSLNVASRMKEFSIRKVLGAGFGNLFQSVNRQFFWILIIAIALGAPSGFYLVKGLVESVYKYYKPLDFVPIAMSASVLIITALITTLTQVLKVQFNNPVSALRNE